MLENIAFEAMQPLLNDRFVLEVDSEQSVDIELVDVSQLQVADRPVYSWQKAVEPSKSTLFALVFRVPHSLGATQKMYQISHPQLGDLGGIFLVPIATDEDGLYFEAVFG